MEAVVGRLFPRESGVVRASGWSAETETLLKKRKSFLTN